MGETITLIRAKAGVRLEQIETFSTGQEANIVYRLSTHRPPQPRVFAEEAAAQDAFDLEVIASLMDPVVAKLIERGMIEV